MTRKRTPVLPKKTILIATANAGMAAYFSRVRKDCRYVNMTVEYLPADSLEALIKATGKARIAGKFASAWAVFGLSDFNLEPADLAGLKVCVQKDSSGLAALEGKPELTATFSELVQVDSYLNALMELESGSVDAIVMDEIVARYEIQTSGKPFVVIDEAVSAEEYGVGFLKGNKDLRDEVQKTLEEMAKDGTMAKISEKWFGADITTIGK